jgi:hypothetical protein
MRSAVGMQHVEEGGTGARGGEWGGGGGFVCVCVNSAIDALGLSHDGLLRHRAGLPAHLGAAAVNKD